MDDDLENDFLRFMEVERSASPRTLVNYRLALGSCRTWFGDAFPGWRNTAADDFRRWLFDMMKQGLSKATIRLRFAAVRSFYKFLVHRRGHAKSPVAEVQLPKPEKKLPVVLNLAQIDEVFAAASQQYVLYGMGFGLPAAGASSAADAAAIAQLAEVRERSRVLASALPENRTYFDALAAQAA